MKKNFKNYAANFFKEARKNLNDLKSSKTAYKQIPNLLTFSRAIAPIFINILFFSGNILGALAVCGLTFLTDAFDGVIARKLNIQSEFGADLDAICDKVLIAGIALPIIILNPIMIANVILETLISITNIRAELNGKKPKSTKLGKLKTWVLSLTVLSGYVTSLLNINLTLLKSLLMITPAVLFQSATFLEYLQINKKETDEAENTEDEKKETSIIDLETVKQKEKEKTIKKEVEKPLNLEDYKKLREELLKEEPEKEKVKKKTIN